MSVESTEYLKFKVGALMYTPALKEGVAEKLKSLDYQYLSSLAFCLEDSIVDEALDLAEKTLKATLKEIKEITNKEILPLIFIRVRTPEHLLKIYNLLKNDLDVVTGFILPKFDLSNAEDFLKNMDKINQDYKVKKIYCMPILESEGIVPLETRVSTLIGIKKLVDQYNEYVLGIRVGANDLCNYYGLRRNVDTTIYDIEVIKNILIDIIAVFSRDYVVSGAVWEYFSDSNNLDFKLWSKGLEKELEMDRLNGFFGKTAIHPSQLQIIQKSLRVSKSDYDDALNILKWESGSFGVEKSKNSSRMNEVKCHTKWANKIRVIGEIYGVKDE